MSEVTTWPTLEDVEAQLAALERQQEALENQRRAFYKQAQLQREAEAGDPQVGDLVVFPRKYGDAQRGEIGVVTARYHENDYDVEMVSLDLLRGSIGAQLTAVMKVNHPDAAKLWAVFVTTRDQLREAVDNATGIWPSGLY